MQFIGMHAGFDRRFVVHDIPGFLLGIDGQYNQAEDRLKYRPGHINLFHLDQILEIVVMVAHDLLFFGGHILRPAFAGAQQLDKIMFGFGHVFLSFVSPDFGVTYIDGGDPPQHRKQNHQIMFSPSEGHNLSHPGFLLFLPLGAIQPNTILYNARGSHHFMVRRQSKNLLERTP